MFFPPSGGPNGLNRQKSIMLTAFPKPSVQSTDSSGVTELSSTESPPLDQSIERGGDPRS